MAFSLFINFDGECKEAVEFYAKVFKSEVQDLMTYAEAPPEENVTAEDKNKIMYACVPIFGSDIMFMDMPSGMPLIKGNNINPTIGTNDADEVKRVFDLLKEGGTIDMDLQWTFWSDLYGMVTDKYGIIWQLMLSGEES